MNARTIAFNAYLLRLDFVPSEGIVDNKAPLRGLDLIRWQFVQKHNKEVDNLISGYDIYVSNVKTEANRQIAIPSYMFILNGLTKIKNEFEDAKRDLEFWSKHLAEKPNYDKVNKHIKLIEAEIESLNKQNLTNLQKQYAAEPESKQKLFDQQQAAEKAAATRREQRYREREMALKLMRSRQ